MCILNVFIQAREVRKRSQTRFPRINEDFFCSKCCFVFVCNNAVW